MQQAEDGAFLFQNKLEPSPHAARLVNLEWWAIGRLSAALGGRPFLAYRIFGVFASLALLAAVDAWLRRAGLPASHRLPALVLVATGGGLGGLIFELTDRPVGDSLDLSTGVLPLHGDAGEPALHGGHRPRALGPARARAGPAVARRGPRHRARARPTLRRRGAGSREGPLGGRPRAASAVAAALVPLLAPWPRPWLTTSGSSSPTRPTASFSGRYDFPGAALFAWALGPAAAVAAFAPGPARDDPAGRARAHLWDLGRRGPRPRLRSAAGIRDAVPRRPGYPPPRARGAGVGAPSPRAHLRGPRVAFASTAVVATRIVLAPDPNWFVSRELMAAAEALRPHCRPADVVYAPPDVSLYTIARTACRAVVAHEAASGFAERAAEMGRFYREGPPEWRRQVLDRLGVTVPGRARRRGLGPRRLSRRGEWLPEGRERRGAGVPDHMVRASPGRSGLR